MAQQRMAVDFLTLHRLRLGFGKVNVHRQVSFRRHLSRARKKLIRAALNRRRARTRGGQFLRSAKRFDEFCALMEPSLSRFSLRPRSCG